MQTSRPQTAERLEDAFGAVIQALETAVLVLQVRATSCACVFANRALLDRYGVDDVEGREPGSFLEPATAALLEAAARRARHTGEPVSYADVGGIGGADTQVIVVPVPGPGGLVAWMARRASPGRERREAGAALDRLTQKSSQLQHANAELARSNADLAVFAYVASHDLTEPLRMVASHLDFVRARSAEALDDRCLRSIDFAIEGAQRMRALVDALLDLAQVSTQPVEPKPVPLDEVVAEALADLEGLLQEAGGRVTVGELPIVHGDRKTLTTVMENLLANAAKFRSSMPLEVEVRARRIENTWRVEVADNGIGIPLEYRGQVFEMFRRLQPRSQHPGTGMGLAICRRVVERHGGEISVDENPGGGTVVGFTLGVGSGAS